MNVLPPPPDHLAGQAAFLTEHEQRLLWQAAVTMADSRGILLRLTALFGRRIDRFRDIAMQAGERLGGNAWADVTRRAQEAIEDVLWSGYRYATFGLEVVPSALRPRQPRSHFFHKLATAASGTASGFAGLPGVLVDLPFTTATILRSIATVARDFGEDLGAEDTRRACLEVLAFGGPASFDDEVEIGYWATRLGVSHLGVNLLIKSAAGRFGVLLSDKAMAQIVPVAGAISGGVLNYAFTDYYQSMARVHFCLRALERRTGDAAAVKTCFDSMVVAARERRRIGKRRPRPAKAILLPRD